jgi:hypothetical protein
MRALPPVPLQPVSILSKPCHHLVASDLASMLQSSSWEDAAQLDCLDKGPAAATAPPLLRARTPLQSGERIVAAYTSTSTRRCIG